MALELYEPTGQGRKYVGINVGLGAISLSIEIAKKLKELGWKRALILYDKDESIIKFEKTEEITQGYAIKWQTISVGLGRVMPQQRYYLREQKEKEGKELIFAMEQ